MRVVTRGGRSQVMESDEWEVACGISRYGVHKVGLLVIVTGALGEVSEFSLTFCIAGRFSAAL